MVKVRLLVNIGYKGKEYKKGTEVDWPQEIVDIWRLAPLRPADLELITIPVSRVKELPAQVTVYNPPRKPDTTPKPEKVEEPFMPPKVGWKIQPPK